MRQRQRQRKRETLSERVREEEEGRKGGGRSLREELPDGDLGLVSMEGL